MNKMFVFFPLTPKDGEHFAVMKCDPEKTVELREKYAGITKGYYAGNNLKWNSVYIRRDVPDALIVELIKHSVEEVVKQLPKKKHEEYRKLKTEENASA
jgi:predicted DNA-binding protein (MmcQ/YjbR family)